VEPLDHRLRHHRLASLVAEAELICIHPDRAERIAQAKRLVREAMLDRALGRITPTEQAEVTRIVSRVLPSTQPTPADGSPVGPLDGWTVGLDVTLASEHESWDEMVARITQPSLAHAISIEVYCHFLETSRPVRVGGVFVAPILDSTNLRLFWRAGIQHFCRQLTEAESREVFGTLPFGWDAPSP
jgi:hypothetical protein